MGYILITGASAGLGSDFARQLAAEGRDLILVARRLARLEELAAELTAQYGVKIHALPADLADLSAIEALAAHLKQENLLLDGLVNNAGYGLIGDFTASTIEEQLGMINLNVCGLMAATHALIPLFSAAHNRFIINVASVASFVPIPGFAVYAASKAAVLSFSDALGSELADVGITVSALCPGPTATEFTKVARIPEEVTKNIKSMTPEDVVRRSLAHRHTPVVITGGSNKLTVLMAKFLPRSLLRRKTAKRRARFNNKTRRA